MTRRLLSAEELAERAVELSLQPPAEQAAKRLEEGLLILVLGGEAYGLSAPDVQEVVCRPAVTPLPVNPPNVLGVMNLRGEVVAVLDLAGMFGLPKGGSRPYAVVVRRLDVVLAVAADEVLDVEWFGAAARQPVVATVASEVAALLTGVFHWRGRLVTGVDLTKVLEHPELAKLRRAKEPAGP